MGANTIAIVLHHSSQTTCLISAFAALHQSTAHNKPEERVIKSIAFKNFKVCNSRYMAVLLEVSVTFQANIAITHVHRYMVVFHQILNGFAMGNRFGL